MDVESFLSEYEEFLHLQLLKPRTIRSYVHNARHLFLVQGIESSSSSSLKSYFRNLRNRVGDYRYNHMVETVRSLSFFVKSSSLDEYSWIVNVGKILKLIPKSKMRTKNELFAYTLEQKYKILRSCDSLTTRMIFWMAFNTGIRKTALLSLRLSDVSEKGVYVRAEITKTGKSRFIPFENPTQKRKIKAYLAYRSKQDSEEAWLFVSRQGNRVNWDGGTGWRVYKGLSAKTGFPVTLHRCRYTFAVDVWEQTGDLVLVQRLLGHASPEQTAEYLKLREDEWNQIIREKMKGVRFL